LAPWGTLKDGGEEEDQERVEGTIILDTHIPLNISYMYEAHRYPIVLARTSCRASYCPKAGAKDVAVASLDWSGVAHMKAGRNQSGDLNEE
jgi:hypothetical protein